MLTAQDAWKRMLKSKGYKINEILDQCEREIQKAADKGKDNVYIDLFELVENPEGLTFEREANLKYILTRQGFSIVVYGSGLTDRRMSISWGWEREKTLENTYHSH